MTQALNLSQLANNVNSSGVLAIAGGGTGSTTSTGSGSVVLNNTPTLISPSISGSTSGAITLAVPSVAGTNTATLPSATGTVMVSGAMPAFSAYANSVTSFTTSVNTKIAFNTKEFDTANCYDATTNYRYTPNVAGYYQVTAGNIIAPSVSGNRWLYLYKNGSFVRTMGFCPPAGVNYSQTYGTILVYMNGTTDYIEIYGVQNSGGTLTNAASSTDVFFQAVMVRAA